MNLINKWRTTGAVCLTALTAINAAHAEGTYVYGNFGSSSLEHSIERSLDTSAPNLPTQDSGGVSHVKETDFSIGLGIGYKTNINDKVFLGVEGFYNTHNNTSKNINGVLVTEIDLESSYGIRLLAGVNATNDLAIYVHGGFTELDYDIRNSYTFAPPVKNRSDSESGFTFGIGADYKLNNHYSVFTQYSQTTDVDFNGIPEVAGGTGRVNPNELDLTEVTVGIKYSF